MFCSNDCMEAASEIFPEFECGSKLGEVCHRMLCKALIICDGSFEKLKQLVENPESSSRTVFDFDFGDVNDPQYKYHQLLAFNSLIAYATTKNNECVEHHPVLRLLDDEEEREIVKNFFHRLVRIIEWNSIGLDWHVPLQHDEAPGEGEILKRFDIGAGILLFGSLFNHSCVQNVDRLVVDNKIVFYAKESIPKDQQLFINYG